MVGHTNANIYWLGTLTQTEFIVGNGLDKNVPDSAWSWNWENNVKTQKWLIILKSNLIKKIRKEWPSAVMPPIFPVYKSVHCHKIVSEINALR